MEIRYHKAKVTDAEETADIALKMWDSHTKEDLTQTFSESIKNPDSVVFIAEDNNGAVGFAMCGLRREYVEGADRSPVGYLEGIYVEERCRGIGCAKHLLKLCEYWASEKGCEEFASDCELGNETSLQFHLSSGFRESNRIICFIKKLNDKA